MNLSALVLNKLRLSFWGDAWIQSKLSEERKDEFEIKAKKKKEKNRQ